MRPLWKTVWRFLKTLKTELPYDPTVILLGPYPEKMLLQKDTYTLMCIAALFTVAKTGKHLKYPSTNDKGIKKMYIFSGISLSH